MRAIWLSIVAIQLVLVSASSAEEAADADHSISEMLPLFAKNHCETHKDPANQLFCADPDLIEAGTRLAGTIQERLNRIPDRLLAVEGNAQWIRDRNLSCGALGRESIRFDDIEPVVACLMK